MPKPPYRVRPETAVLTRGFDPRLSVGAARPPVYRTSTFVFSSPEAAERAFAIALGKIQPTENEDVDLIYARLSHPNAEILEDQLVPLERGARCAAVFNSGMAAIATCCFTFCRGRGNSPYAAALRGHAASRPRGPRAARIHRGRGSGRRPRRAGPGCGSLSGLKLVFVETPANPTLRMTDIAHAVDVARVPPGEAAGRRRQHLPRADVPAPARDRRDLAIYSATKFLGGQSDILGGVVLAYDEELVQQLRGVRALFGNILQRTRPGSSIRVSRPSRSG